MTGFLVTTIRRRLIFRAIIPQMRICTYNIHGGTDSNRKASVPLITETLRETRADIILLQEVDRYLPRSGYRDQVCTIAHALGYEAHFYGRLRFGWSAFGNAILIRGKALDVNRLPMPSSGGEPRCAVGVRAEFAGIGVVSTWNTHLGLDNRWRKTQLDALAARIGRGHDPVLVGGDFNARLEDDEVRNFLDQTGLTPLTGDFPTFPCPQPTSRIDFILGRGLTEVKSETNAAAGSDHCLLWADLIAAGSQPSI